MGVVGRILEVKGVSASEGICLSSLTGCGLECIVDLKEILRIKWPTRHTCFGGWRHVSDKHSLVNVDGMQIADCLCSNTIWSTGAETWEITDDLEHLPTCSIMYGVS